jgi:hypothetical protein
MTINHWQAFWDRPSVPSRPLALGPEDLPTRPAEPRQVPFEVCLAYEYDSALAAYAGAIVPIELVQDGDRQVVVQGRVGTAAPDEPVTLDGLAAVPSVESVILDPSSGEASSNLGPDFATTIGGAPLYIELTTPLQVAAHFFHESPTDVPMKITARIVDRQTTPVVRVTGRHTGERIDGRNGVEVVDAALLDCDLGRQRVPDFGAKGATFERCDFSRTRLGGTLGYGKGAIFRDCRFVGADLTRADPGIARFERCDFDRARLDGWFASQAEFVECRFSGRLRRMRFYGRVDPAELAGLIGRERNEFVGNDFEAADLTDVEFVGGINLRAQRLPNDPHYMFIDDLPQRLRLAERVISGWPAGKERAIALDEIAVLRMVYTDQPSIFRRRGQTIPEFERIWQTVEAVEPPR